MSTLIYGILFDGETLAGKPVTLAIATGRLQDSGPGAAVDVSLADVRISDRLANVPRFLYLPGDQTVESGDNEAIDELLEAQRRGGLVRMIHSLEVHARASAAATVILVVTTVAAIWWGLPILARRAAMAVPVSIEQQAGRAGLATINQVLAPSNLAAADRQRVQAQLDRLMQAGGISDKPQIVYRSMGGKFPNAFALPGGIIVISDELVELVDHDDEIAAVLAHEIGHWQRRHGLQGVLRTSTALLVVTTVTGDLSTLTTFASTIPFVILQRGYSREFEAEADADAVQLLLGAKIDPAHFASILQKLEESRPTAGNDLTYLSTHPGTADRVKELYLAATRLGWVNSGINPPPARKPKPASVATPPAIITPKLGRRVEKSPDVHPVALVRGAPNYPFELRAAKVSGTVQVEFIIDEHGDVHDATVIRSSHQGFEEPALAALAAWKFKPAVKEGRNVATLASQLLEFNADE